MVKLTVDLIARGTSGYTKKNREESINHYLKRLTHLYLEDKAIDDIGDGLSLCKNLSVLYLYDNKLNRIPNLNHNSHLTHLYLQNNTISRIENLAGLPRLQKLYLGGNTITVIEGLDKLQNLQELHLENQKLPVGEKLLFDPRSLVPLSRCLQVMNVSGNSLDTIRDLEVLSELTQFYAADNDLCDMKEMAHCLNSWPHLCRLELMGNPLCHKSKYRDRIIIMARHLEILDGKEITETSKQFLRNWQASKEAQKRKRHISRQPTQEELPPVTDRAIRHSSVPGYLMPALPKKQFEEVLARSLSNPNSAIHDQRGPEISPPKYLNTMGTFYHNTTTSMAKLHPPLVNFGDLAAGDLH